MRHNRRYPGSHNGSIATHPIKVDVSPEFIRKGGNEKNVEMENSLIMLRSGSNRKDTQIFQNLDVE